MQQKVYITGMGIISALGHNVIENLNAFEQQKSGIAAIKLIETIHKNKLPAGEIKLNNESLQQLLERKAEMPNSRTALLSLIAAQEAYNQAKVNTNPVDFRTGLISASSVGGMDRTEYFFRNFSHDPQKGKLVDVIHHDCGDNTTQIARFLGIHDFVSTVSTACSSSANSIMAAARMIQHNQLDCVIAGGSDALTAFTLNGFNSLKIVDKQAFKHFDKNRDVLNLGEAAAFLVLESEAALEKNNKKPLAQISSWANANDAFHQTASSPQGTGASLAMKNALQKAALSPKNIDYINAHGTGTGNNDLSEGKAIKTVFKNEIPPFSSTKPFTGHTLGAAGAVEAVFSVLSIQHGFLFPNLNFNNVDPELDVSPNINLLKAQTVNHVLSNSFGFGGNNTSLIFSKV